jgi:hypothetical protein
MKLTTVGGRQAHSHSGVALLCWSLGLDGYSQCRQQSRRVAGVEMIIPATAGDWKGNRYAAGLISSHINEAHGKKAKQIGETVIHEVPVVYCCLSQRQCKNSAQECRLGYLEPDQANSTLTVFCISSIFCTFSITSAFVPACFFPSSAQL